MAAGRIRSIKPEILDDEKAAELSDAAWRLFVSTWLLADDHGRLRGSATWLRSQIFWARPEVREAEVEAMLAELEAKNFLLRYEVNGQKYIEIRTWKRHQKVDHPGVPRIPEPFLGKPREDLANVREPFARPSRSLAPDLGTGTDPGPGPGPGRGPDPASDPLHGLGGALQREWAAKTGVIMASGFHELILLFVAWAKAHEKDPAQHIPALVDACVKRAASMSPGKRVSMAPIKFTEDRHWAAVQEILNGTRKDAQKTTGMGARGNFKKDRDATEDV